MLTGPEVCGKISMVMQMLINSVVKNEAIRNKQMIEQYEEMIKDLPRGSLICRKNEYYYLKYRKDEYYYLKYRKDGKICDEYIGKDPEIIAKIKEKIEQRKHCENMISVLKQEQKAISRILEGLQ